MHFEAAFVAAFLIEAAATSKELPLH